MWNKIADHFKHHPERLAVARILVENGLNVKDDQVFCNEIEIPTVRVARAASVDRRTVIETLKIISGDPLLGELFQRIRSTGPSLKGLAKYLGLGVLEITPDDPRTVGILANASSIIADAGISIRQALVDDPELNPEPKLTLVTEKKLPGTLVPEILKINGVEKVSIY